MLNSIKNLKSVGKLLLCMVLAIILSVGCCGCLDSDYLSSDVPLVSESSDIESSESTKTCEHSFKAATCIAPETCELCGEISGEATGHTFISATCTQPQRCSLCGVEQGVALGHKFSPATCITDEKCSVCGAVNSPAKGHSFSGDSCSSCGAKNPNYVAQVTVWIPTKGGTKYHNNPSCSNMSNPSEVTKERAEQLGFTPCKKCYG